MQGLTLFVSSTGDVREERQAVGSVVEKLQARYREVVRLEVVERDRTQPADARIDPGACDGYLCILGSKFHPKDDAGIERELEADAAACERQGIARFLHCRERVAGDDGMRKRIDRACEHFRAGKHPPARRDFATTEDFARCFEEELATWLAGKFGEGESRPIEGNPYRGAGVFDYDDAPRFFGRDRPLAEALAQLRRNHAAGRGFLLIYGEGGVGKSSMMRAGLAPRLTAEGFLPDVGAWCGTTFQPVEDGTTPLESLARAIAGALPELEKIRDTSRPAAKTPKRKKRRKPKSAADPVWDHARLVRAFPTHEGRIFAVAAIVAALDRVTAGKPAQMLMLVDQLDDLFTDGQITPAMRDEFFHALAALVRSRRVLVVATLRSGCFPRVARQRELFQLVRHDGGFFLGPPEEAELRSIVRVPALAAGLRFEAESGLDLSERIVADATGRSDALPWLAEVLEKLYQQRDGELLTWRAYRGIAGKARPALNPRPAAMRPHRRAAALVLAGVAVGALGVGIFSDRPPPPVPAQAPAVEPPPDPGSALAAASFDLGLSRIAAGAPDEALPHLLAALERQPDHLDAQALLLATLQTTAWHFPVAEISHPLPVRHLAFSDDGGSLFASIDGGFNTTLRWNLANGTVDSLLKPELAGETRKLIVAPGGGRLIVQRGHLFYLCDAVTMKPVGTLPVASNSEAGAIAWSAEGALLAYPVKAGDELSWVIADAATGATIRQSEVLAVGDPLSARLDRARLRAIHSDGTLIELPIVPEQPLVSSIGESRLSQAVLSPDGSELLAQAPARKPVLFSLSQKAETIELVPKGTPRAGSWVEARGSDAAVRSAMLEAMNEGVPIPLEIDGRVVRSRILAPLRMEDPVATVVFSERRVAAATGAGRAVVEQILGSSASTSDGASARESPALLEPDRLGIVHYHDGFRIVPVDGEPLRIEVPGSWKELTGAALSPDASRVVVAGRGEIEGIAFADPATGRIVADPEPVEGAGAVAFLDDRRVAVTGSRGVRILEIDGDRLKQVAEIPVAGAFDLFRLPHAGSLAIASEGQVTLHDPGDFSRVTTLPFAGRSRGAWAEDRETGWLACESGRHLTVWSPRNRCVIFHLRVAGGGRIGFTDRDGLRGVWSDGGSATFPLAQLRGLTPVELDDLREYARGLSGVGHDPASGELVKLSRDERRKSLDRDFGALSSFSMIRDPHDFRDLVLALPFATAAADAWLPVWERLAMVPGVDEMRLIRWSSTLGEHPWFRRYLRGRIARSDVDLGLAWEGEKVTPGNVGWMHGLAGDSPALRELKQASWTAAAGRDEALALLDAHVEKTRETFQAAATPEHAVAHAEALAWRGDSAAAADFLKGKIPGDAALSLAQAHFLLSFGLAEGAKEALVAALERLGSDWLWRQWMQAGATGEPVAAAVERTMAAVGGRGPAAVEALWISLVEQDAAAIAACLKSDAELPEPLALYAAGTALWADGKKAEAFALWPDGFPDLAGEAATGDWNGWEGALPSSAAESLFSVMEEELRMLIAPPDAGPEALRELGTRLLEPETRATFGIKPVRDAMVSCARALAADEASHPLVMQLVEGARLAGAPPADCLRIEARSYMAAGQFTLAYSRWLQLLESADGEILADDYLDAARCVMEDRQDAAAIELLQRGKRKFPDDSSFAYAAAWLLLTRHHPEEAGVMLEHGFAIPFRDDEREIALAMLVCAAEQTLRTEQADETYLDLQAISPSWGDEASLQALEWPAALQQALLVVAERNR